MPEQLLHWIQPTAYGLLGLVVLLVLFGWLVPVRQLNRELRREREVSDQLQEALDAANARADRYAVALAELAPLIRDRVRR